MINSIINLVYKYNLNIIYMCVIVSNLARTKLTQIAQHYSAKSIRLTLEREGCKAFKYKFSTTYTKNIPTDNIIQLCDDINLYVDKKLDKYIANTRISWTSDIMGEGFVFQNPNSMYNCKCRCASFTV